MLQIPAMMIATMVGSTGGAYNGNCDLGSAQQLLQNNRCNNTIECPQNLPTCPDFNFPGVTIPGNGQGSHNQGIIIPGMNGDNNGGNNNGESNNGGNNNGESNNGGNNNGENNNNGNNTIAGEAKQVVDLVNAERAKAGLSPLSVDTKVDSAANVRAKEIEQTFSHTRPNGSSYNTALNEAGAQFSGSGENIAWGQKTPQEVMNSWMNSEGHRTNIMNPNYKNIGVGVSKNASGTMYWTQLFTY